MMFPIHFQVHMFNIYCFYVVVNQLILSAADNAYSNKANDNETAMLDIRKRFAAHNFSEKIREKIILKTSLPPELCKLHRSEVDFWAFEWEY